MHCRAENSRTRNRRCSEMGAASCGGVRLRRGPEAEPLVPRKGRSQVQWQLRRAWPRPRPRPRQVPAPGGMGDTALREERCKWASEGAWARREHFLGSVSRERNAARQAPAARRGVGPGLGRPRGLAGYPGTEPGASGWGLGPGSAGSNCGVSGAQSPEGKGRSSA